MSRSKALPPEGTPDASAVGSAAEPAADARPKTRSPDVPVRDAAAAPRDVTALILSKGWRSGQHLRAGANGKKLDPAIRALAESWFPPVLMDAAYEREFRRRLASAPKTMRLAVMATHGLGLMLAWWVGGGRDPEPDRMLSPVHLCGFRDAMKHERYSQSTRNEYVLALNQLGLCGNPRQMEEWKALNTTPSGKSHFGTACDDDEVRGLFLQAWAQPSARLRDGMLGLLYLPLGVGLYEGPVTTVRGTHVRRLSDGSAGVTVGKTLLSVRPRYAPGLLDLASRIGKGLLVPGATGKNKTSALKAELVLSSDGPRLQVERLVATFRWWLGQHADLAAYVQQCGTHGLIHYADMCKTMAPSSEPVATTWSTLADDDQDGPWRPDWVARHHRK